MNKHYKILIVIAVLLVIITLSVCKTDSRVKSFSDITYLNDIYTTIEQEDFFVGRIEGNSIELKNRDFNTIKNLKLKSKGKEIKIKSIFKENEQIYFVMNGSIDDSDGIVFCKSSSVNMDGIYTLIRIEGNAYYYETYRR